MKFPTPSSPGTCAGESFKIALALVMLVALGGWQAQAQAQTPSPSRKDATPAGAPVVRIKSLTQGDTACYVTLENARGKRSEEMASFELCEQTRLIGQRVRLKRERSAVMAASCQGDPECRKTQTVNLIVKAEKVR